MQRDNLQEGENNKTGTKDGISPPPCGFPSALSFPNSPPLCRLLMVLRRTLRVCSRAMGTLKFQQNMAEITILSCNGYAEISTEQVYSENRTVKTKPLGNKHRLMHCHVPRYPPYHKRIFPAQFLHLMRCEILHAVADKVEMLRLGIPVAR